MEKIIINFVGDVWFGDHPVCIGHGVNSVSKNKKSNFFFKNVKSLLDGDLNFCNLETVLSEHNLDIKNLESIEMRGASTSIRFLKYANFNLVNVANNHMMQHGSKAFYDTINNLERNNIAYIGCDNNLGGTNSYKFCKGDTEICFLGYSFVRDAYTKETICYSFRNKYNDILEDITLIKNNFNGLIICSFHWGDEFIYQPSLDQIEFAHSLIDLGVSMIIGHHPHVIQGIEIYKNCLIAYSLGNFIFDLWDKRTKNTFILKIMISQNKIVTYSIIPAFINSNFQVIEAVDLVKYNIFSIINNCNNMIIDKDKRLSHNQYTKEVIKLEKQFRYSSYFYFLKNIYKYKFIFIYQMIMRTIVSKFNNLMPHKK